MARKKQSGRSKGQRTRGYYFRSGRGWVASDATPLTYEDGLKIKDKDAPDAALKAAYGRYLAAQSRPAEVPNDITVAQVVRAYLKHAKANSANKTYHDRADTLFDFCYGFPPAFRDKENGKPVPKPTAGDRIHAGYGGQLATTIIPFHIDQWLQAHPTWQGGRKTRIQAVKRAFNYAAEARLIPENPIRGYRTPKVRPRVTYFTDEQEAALLKHARSKVALALKVLIRTGARPGIEFAKLTAAHVVDHGDRMEWRFKAHESKTKKERVLRITDKETIETVRGLVKRFPEGPLFKNARHTPWTAHTLSERFRPLVERVKRIEKIEFDEDVCLYTARHTYAKRTLQGYWTGRSTNIETLARLMGNTPQVCRDHYLQWTETYNEPLWDSA